MLGPEGTVDGPILGLVVSESDRILNESVTGLIVSKSRGVMDESVIRMVMS